MILNNQERNRIAPVAITVVIFLLISPQVLSTDASTSVNLPTNSLSSHWLPGQSCFRDELNQSDEDYYNCWLDNAGKILASSEITNDVTDANNALLSLTRYGLNSSNYYLPEAIVNSTSDIISAGSVTNRIAMLAGSNQSSSKLEQLGVGDYYAGEQILAYIGSDRILVNGTLDRSTNSTVFQTAQGFVKLSLFNTSIGQIYVYLNATLSPGNPYTSVSMQVLPLSSPITSSDLLYLQVFSSSGQFNNATLYNGDGSYERPLAYNNGSPAAQNGTIIAYSSQQNVFTEDSVAISFTNASSQVNDFEHWYQNGPFDSLSWIGIAYNSPQDIVGKLSAPIVSKVYPIEHLDYHLINETAKYIAQGVKNTTVSPPVSFGFIAYGLALASSSQPTNHSLSTLARNFWNYYYSRYASSGDHSTPYARSINTFALAGFKLYSCNVTVENFTRAFLGNSSGTSIEENGWGAAASYHLESCTGATKDIELYNSFVRSFTTNALYFAGVLSVSTRPSETTVPNSTFQYAEAASGLMLGGVPYNEHVVLSLMNAVYQSNISGTVLNQPYHGDLANTETLPAYMLSTWLFQNEMQKGTEYSITGLIRANITSVDYSGGTLLIGANGKNGSISISRDNSTETLPVNGSSVVPISLAASTYTKTVTSAASTVTSVYTTTVTKSVQKTSSCDLPLIVMGTALAVLGIAALGFALRRPNKR